MNIDLLHQFNNCRHPTKLYNPHIGDYIFVRCGKCKSCLSSKSAQATQLCQQEENDHKHTAFITLTYDEQNVPQLLLLPHKNNSIYDVIDNCPRSSTYQEFITNYVSHNDETFKLFLKKAHSYETQQIRYCLNSDLQKFIKRIRFHLSKYHNTQVRYYAISEYGPQTFRPHFHLLLYFDNSTILPILAKLISEQWKYGNTNYSLSRNRVASYVAGYVNSFVCLPSLLKNRAFSPRSFHSRYFGAQYYKTIRKDVYTSSLTPFENITYNLNGNLRQLYPTTQIRDIFFPKSFDFYGQSKYNLLTLYTIYSKLSTYFKEDNPSKLTKYVLVNNDIPFVSHFLKLLHISDSFPTNHFGWIRKLSPDEYGHYIHHQLSNSVIDKTFSRIYVQLLTSKHFLSFCCGSYDDIIITPPIMLDNILNYYQQSDYNSLIRQYQTMIDYHEHTGSLDYSIFYPLSFTNLEYHNIYNSNPFITDDNTFRDFYFESKIKHKKLNDANNIFID